MKSLNIKGYFIIFLCSAIVDILVSSIRAIDLNTAIILDGCIFAFFTYIVLSKYSHSSRNAFLITLSIFTGAIILDLPSRIFHFESTKSSFLNMLISQMMIIFSFLFYLFKNKILLFSFITIWGYLVFIVQPKWKEYVAYGKLESNVNISQFKLDASDSSFDFETIGTKYVLLDFWSSTCGICFKKFPKLQELYDKFKENENVLIASVFITHENENYSDGTKLLREDGYTFPVIGCTDWKSSLISTLGIDGVPTVIILNENKEVIFRGSIEFAESKLNSLMVD